MTCYGHFLNAVGIPFVWNVNHDTKKLEYRDLNGPEKILIFQKISMKQLMPDQCKAESILWDMQIKADVY